MRWKNPDQDRSPSCNKGYFRRPESEPVSGPRPYMPSTLAKTLSLPVQLEYQTSGSKPLTLQTFVARGRSPARVDEAPAPRSWLESFPVQGILRSGSSSHPVAAHIRSQGGESNRRSEPLPPRARTPPGRSAGQPVHLRISASALESFASGHPARH